MLQHVAKQNHVKGQQSSDMTRQAARANVQPEAHRRLAYGVSREVEACHPPSALFRQDAQVPEGAADIEKSKAARLLPFLLLLEPSQMHNILLGAPGPAMLLGLRENV